VVAGGLLGKIFNLGDLPERSKELLGNQLQIIRLEREKEGEVVPWRRLAEIAETL